MVRAGGIYHGSPTVRASVPQDDSHSYPSTGLGESELRLEPCIEQIINAGVQLDIHERRAE